MYEIRNLACPLPTAAAENCILLAHGEGGSLMRKFIRERIAPRFRGVAAEPMDDAAVLPGLQGCPVMTTDAFVVSPLFFPGGDIGTLAVYGTVNDLVVRGAQPLWLTLAMIIEEGLSLAIIDRVLDSIMLAARQCGVSIVAGDTKVVPRGAADGLFLTTTGLGQLLDLAPLGSTTIEIGDVLLVTGPVGRHGIAILAAREQMHFDPPPASDCGPLTDAVAALRAAGIRPRAVRDATRGGVTAVLHEWAQDCGQTLVIEEGSVPVSSDVRGVCELLGLDPLCVANEGTMVVALRAQDADAALAALRGAAISARSTKIGEVRARRAAAVIIRRATGREQPLIEPSGAPLPRIC